MEFNNQTITLFNKYFDEASRDTKYKRTLIENCKFNPIQAVDLGNIQVKANDNGKLFVFEEDLVMSEYVDPIDYKGIGFTFNPEDIVVIGNYPNEINSVKELESYNRYTIKDITHNKYSFILPYHFSIGVK